VTLILVLQNVHLRSNLVVPRSRDFQVWCVLQEGQRHIPRRPVTLTPSVN